MERGAEFERTYFYNILIISKSKNYKTKWLEPLQRTKYYKYLIHIPIQEKRRRQYPLTKSRTKVKSRSSNQDIPPRELRSSGLFAAISGSSLPTFRENISVSIFKGQEYPDDGTDKLSQNVCKELPLLAA